MAKWWELAIPTAGTLIGTLSAGWLGAVYQRKNGERLLLIQSEENERQREAQAREAERARTFEVWKEREARSHEERKSAYITFWSLFGELRKNESVQAQLEEQIAALGDSDETAVERERLKSQHLQAIKRFKEIAPRQIAALETLMFVGAKSVANAANRLLLVRNNGESEDDINAAVSEFLRCAHADLSHSFETSTTHPSRLPSTRPPGERAAARPATSSGP
ncbi:hypothetical protein [Verrucosispora sp. WMMD1129]|uniref:hypothetical protein n=1 Tax=Verrucosispora sp. WMMD1129 TaxID=3016093 RepID=UPI002499FE0E|nr:hypothetical protein [Verrucosispora sp. WMMD1129]WFE45613.1 hypothetical protein O7624_15250 [Verrucosispora sp. WMMD1129]